MKNYGLPYQGSKKTFSDKIFDCLEKYKPNAKVVLDVFGGGGALSFEAIRRGYKKVIYNEFNNNVYSLVKFLINNKKSCKFGNLPEYWYNFVDRKKFFEIIKGEANTSEKIAYREFVKICWSFGNICRVYMYPDSTAKIKKLGNDYVLLGKSIEGIPDCPETNPTKRRHFLNNYCKKAFSKEIVGYEKDYTEYCRIIDLMDARCPKYTAEEKNTFCQWLRSVVKEKEIKEVVECKAMSRHYLSNKSQQELPNLEEWGRIKKYLIEVKKIKIPQFILDLFNTELRYGNLRKHLQRLEHLQHLELHNYSYDSQEIQDIIDSYNDDEIIIILDPPYQNATGYSIGDFDYSKFQEWLKKQTKTIFCCEYTAPLPDWQQIFFYDKQNLMSTTNKKGKGERIFMNKIKKIELFGCFY